MLTAIEASLYDIGVLNDRGMLPRLGGIPAAARYLTGFRCSSTTTFAARISTSETFAFEYFADHLTVGMPTISAVAIMIDGPSSGQSGRFSSPQLF